MTYMIYRKIGTTNPQLETVQAKGAEIRILRDHVDFNILKVSDMCTHFGNLIGFPITNVYFEEIDLVIKCDLSSGNTRITLEKINKLWEKLNQAVINSFVDIPNGFWEITINLSETQKEIENPPLFFEIASDEVVRTKRDLKHGANGNRRKRCIQLESASLDKK